MTKTLENNKKFHIAAVIPTFNRKDKLNIILTQLVSQTLLPNLKLEIIVCVDGSTDGTNEMIVEKFPTVHIVTGDGSWWYTKSMNMGFKYAQCLQVDFVLTLNDDLEIDENYLRTLFRDFLSLNESKAIMGSLSITNDERRLIHFSGIKRYLLKGFKSEYYHLPLTKPYLESIAGVFVSQELPGRGILIPNEVLLKLDFFDEVFPQYGSDTDFCLRAKRLGIKAYISWNAVVKVNIMLTRIRTDSGEDSIFNFLRDIFDKNSHYSIKKFYKFQHRHYGTFNVMWSVPLYFIANLRALIKKKYS